MIIVQLYRTALGDLKSFFGKMRGGEWRWLLRKARQDPFYVFVEAVKDYAIFTLDEHGRVATWNSGAQHIKGYRSSEILGRSFNCFYTVEDQVAGKPLALLKNAARVGSVQDKGWRVRKDGSQFWADVSITVLRGTGNNVRGFIKITRDLTEQKMSQEMLAAKQEQINQLQKLEALGRLAGTVAHEFNNLLMGIRGCAEQLEKQVYSSGVNSGDVRDIQLSCDRGHALVRQLMSYVRRQKVAPASVSLNDIVAGMRTLIRRAVGPNINLEEDLAVDLPAVCVDSGHIEQILLNLVLNARDAMPDGGVVRIQTSVSGTSASRPIELLVADSGCGMSPEVQEHLFEPFFTTKSSSQGTGLGLATVQSLIQQNNGFIHVDSSPGRGTRVIMGFPAARDAVIGKCGLDVAPDPPTDVKKGRETVFVIEDDELILRNLCRALRSEGYGVLFASSGEEAIHQIHQLNRPITFLISDILLTGINGLEVAVTCRQRFPDLKVIFASAFSEEPKEKLEEAVSGAIVLEKPFPFSKLLQVMASLIKNDSIAKSPI